MRQVFAASGAVALLLVIAAPGADVSAAPKPPGGEWVRNQQWHLGFLEVSEAHRLTQGKGVVVAVPDTGVDPHPDLSGNLLSGTDTIDGGRGTGIGDRDSHGTGMAGLIAAHGRPGNLGALGIAPEAKILPILVTPPNGDGQPDALARGIDYAVAHRAQVISISSGGGSSPELERSVQRALASNIVVVAGAGNRPREQFVGYPASEAGVLAVAGVDRSGQHADISVSGPEVDVAAPGVDIISTSHSGNYRKGTGTSDSTAIVAGAAALVRSKYPDLPASEVVHRLTATAVDKGPPGRDDDYGYGVIDLVAALTADVPPLPPDWATATPPPNTTPATTVAAEPAGGGSDDNSTARGLATLGVIMAAAGGYLLWRRRRDADDPPPRISR
ncbi:type VII secretion-associated serine protease mycosin [Micromonospora purpureochromogenes]|uniref:type VII secretion-associated serine protease mycosin n=1 Tax=Micromonospora purpureochromogenes TaxID=47872 RepID=UPI0033F633C5